MLGENSDAGVIPRMINDIFDAIEERKKCQAENIVLSFSIYEIYKENICDLMGESQK